MSCVTRYFVCNFVYDNNNLQTFDAYPTDTYPTFDVYPTDFVVIKIIDVPLELEKMSCFRGMKNVFHNFIFFYEITYMVI